MNDQNEPSNLDENSILISYRPKPQPKATIRQLEKLLSIIEKQPLTKRGGLKKRRGTTEWENAAAELNSLGDGAVKTVEKWKREWLDLRSRTLKKIECNLTLSEFEERVFSVLKLCTESFPDSTPKAEIPAINSSFEILELPLSTEPDQNIIFNDENIVLHEIEVLSECTSREERNNLGYVLENTKMLTQWTKIVDLVEERPFLHTCGRNKTSPSDYIDAWKAVEELLNNHCGVTKTTKQWMKTWSNLKYRVRAKTRGKQRSKREPLALTKLDKRVLSLCQLYSSSNSSKPKKKPVTKRDKRNKKKPVTMSKLEKIMLSAGLLDSSTNTTPKAKINKSKSLSEIQEIHQTTSTVPDENISCIEEVPKCFIPVCTRRIAKLQMDKLLSIIEKQPYLFKKGRHPAWENAAAELNSFVGGVVRTGRGWKKIWSDTRYRTFKKLPCKSSSLSKLEKRIVAVANAVECSEFISDSTSKAETDNSESSYKLQEIHQSTSTEPDENLSYIDDLCEVQDISMYILPDTDISHFNEVINEQKTPMCPVSDTDISHIDEVINEQKTPVCTIPDTDISNIDEVTDVKKKPLSTIPDKNISLIGKVITIPNTTMAKIPDKNILQIDEEPKMQKKFISIVPIENLSHKNKNIFCLDKLCQVQKKSSSTVSNQNVLHIDESCQAQETPSPPTKSNVQNPVLQLGTNPLKKLYLNKDSESQSQEAIFGKNVGQRLAQMEFKQKFIAQKLISDVLYYAKMVKLNENSKISN